MQVKIEKLFPINAPVGVAWKVLQDIPAVAGCMPGAEITERVDDTHYKGQVRIKIGPATAAFRGDIEIKGIDPVQHELRLLGTGADVKGTSSAGMDLIARVREAGSGQCELVGSAEVNVTGKMASFGGRMLTQVSDQILKQFGDNFTNKVLAAGGGEQAGQAAARAAEQPKEINGLAMMWTLIAGFFRNLFGDSRPPGR